ncbi:single-stranded-DNA-specific exonuclease RecJ [Sphingomonas montana]|uniref:single-stranded-DNA-specific exonuclease RecJ n=1 Tax=Sphingomonas montana TaxID=1843236 RepID=UPI00096CDE48|nr:single-stranded-DNA-specific exonuclease RecJ [Sphingomonas montana]
MSVSVLGVDQSILGQAWRWRSTDSGFGTEPDAGFRPDDLVTQLLLARGCPRDAVESHRLPTIRGFMPDPSIFRDMDHAAERLADAVCKSETVAVFGDYDVDGATSAALMVRLLRTLGLAPTAYIPDRMTEGYGPTSTALLRMGTAGATLIVTVDCGAQAYEPLAAAHSAGIDVIVVDHHKCASELPVAHSVVNPNRLDEDEGAAFGHMAAVGVAFLLGTALLRTLRARNYFNSRPEPRLLDLLDLVALGTVADVASLKGINRAFVTQGLKIMAARRNIGLSALVDVSRLSRAPTCTDLGFALGPRINAGGRVGRSDLGVRLLTTDDPGEAADLALELDRLNGDRRLIETAVNEAAEAALQGLSDQSVAIVAGRTWHPGVIGIVAGRLKERLGRPVIVIAIDDAGIGKGSGRSIAGVDLGAAVLAAKDAGLLIAGGGHAMAAGLSIDAERIPALGAFLHDRLGERVDRSRQDRTMLFDAVLAPGGITPDLATSLDAAGPYGMGWPAPRIAAGPVRIVRADTVGNGHVRVIVAGADGKSVKAVAFRHADTPLGQALLGARPERRLWVAGRVKADDWNGRASAEMHLEDAAWAD